MGVVMKRTSFGQWPCSIARSVDLIGDWWTPLILREAIFGATRFNQFQAALTLGRNVLTARLGRLVEEGLFDKRAYQANPPRYDYVLTGKGKDFFGVLVALAKWGDRWLDQGKGPPMVLRHLTCGSLTPGELICPHCREPLHTDNTRIEPGPGMPPRLADVFTQRVEDYAASSPPTGGD